MTVPPQYFELMMKDNICVAAWTENNVYPKIDLSNDLWELGFIAVGGIPFRINEWIELRVDRQMVWRLTVKQDLQRSALGAYGDKHVE